MPNRILKESICTSESIDRLSWLEEVTFYRLIVNCDDYGRMDARPPILRARLFPLKTLTDKQVQSAIESLRSAGMIDLYKVDGRSYLQIRQWALHQQIRSKKSKFPAPDSELKSDDIKCNQMISDAPVIQSESESESEYESESARARKRASPFTPPTPDEVAAYCRERGNAVDAERFCDFYASKGWMIGNQRMKDWRAAVRTWEKRGETQAAQRAAPGGKEQMLRYTKEQRKATYSAAILDFDTEEKP